MYLNIFKIINNLLTSCVRKLNYHYYNDYNYYNNNSKLNLYFLISNL